MAKYEKQTKAYGNSNWRCRIDIKRPQTHRGKWNLSIVEELYEENDNVIRAIKLCSRKIYIERSIQFLYPLELSCDT